MVRPKKPKVAVVFLAKNEKRHIGKAMGIVSRFKERGKLHHIIVVDDASHDGTGKIAKSLGAHVVRHDLNYGRRVGFFNGVKKAHELGADVVVKLDADIHEFPESTYDAMVKHVSSGKYNMAIPSTFEGKNPLENSQHQGQYAKIDEQDYMGLRALRMKTLNPLITGNKKWRAMFSSKEGSIAGGIDASTVIREEAAKWGLDPALNELIPKEKTILLPNCIFADEALREKDGYPAPVKNEIQVYGASIPKEVSRKRSERAMMLRPELVKALRKRHKK